MAVFQARKDHRGPSHPIPVEDDLLGRSAQFMPIEPAFTSMD
jgi:hypothetical protein